MNKLRRSRSISLVLMLSVTLTFAKPITFITPDQITNTRTGLKITTPGVYVLTDDVSFSVPNAAAITIGSNDVILDMNGKALISDRANQTGINIATVVSPAVNNFTNFYNIVIKNGTFDSFQAFGIQVNGGERNIDLENLTFIAGIPGSGGAQIPTGIFLNGSTNAQISEITIKNCRIVEGRYGILANSVLNVDVENTVLSENFASGAFLTQSSLWRITNCTFSNQQASDTTGSAGLTANDSSLLTIKNCNFSHNDAVSPGVPVAGLNLVGTNMGTLMGMSGSHIIEDCIFSNNAASTGAGIGAQLINTNSCVFRNCIASGNSSLGALSAGFSLSVNSLGNVFQNCTADSNFTFGAGATAAGFNIVGEGNYLVNCTANGNQTFGGGIGAGIFVTAASPGCLVQNCLAINNTTNGFRNDSTSAFIGNFATANGVLNYGGAGTIGFINVPNGTQPPGDSFDERQIDNIQVKLESAVQF